MSLRLRILRALRFTLTSPVSVSDLVEVLAIPSAVFLKKARNNFDSQLNKLKHKGLIVKNKRGVVSITDKGVKWFKQSWWLNEYNRYERI